MNLTINLEFGMLKVHTILFPTDFSENADSAFTLACSLARDCGARIVVLNVVPSPLGRDEILIRRNPDEYYEGPLKAIRQMQAPDHNVRVEHRLADGDAAEEILKVAAELPAGLIIIGTQGRTGLARVVFGSVAEKVLRGATCPVLSVKKSAALPKFQTILLPIDFSASSETALGVAFALARDYHARLILLHVASPGASVSHAKVREQLKQFAGYRCELEDHLRQCQKPECNAELRILEGDPADEIMRVAQEVACDLIVLGTHGRSGLQRLVLGSVAEKISRCAPCPVLLLKSPVDADGPTVPAAERCGV